MQYIFIIAVIFLVIAVLLLITNKRTISFDKYWINLIKEKIVKADKNYTFQKDGEIIIDNKKRLPWRCVCHEKDFGDSHKKWCKTGRTWRIYKACIFKWQD